MSFDATFLIFVAVVFLAFTTEVAAGFGSMVIAMALGMHLYSAHTLVPLLVSFNVMITGYVVSRHHEHIDRQLLFTKILPYMGAGMIGGLLIFQVASGESLRIAFAVFVVAVSLRELRALLAGNGEPRTPLPPRAARVGILGAGVIHGLFATGGPLLVYVLGRSNLDKGSFRSTLATVWLTLNSSLTLIFLFSGRLDSSRLPFVAALIPVLLLCVAAGEWAHTRLDERRFRIAVFALLLMSGSSLLL